MVKAIMLITQTTNVTKRAERLVIRVEASVTLLLDVVAMIEEFKIKTQMDFCLININWIILCNYLNEIYFSNLQNKLIISVFNCA